MMRSLAVILLPILVITVLATRSLDDHPVTVVDWQPVLAQARKAAPYHVLAPTNLPKEWRPTRVSWTKVGDPGLNGQPMSRNTWQLGFLAPDDIYVALSQGDLKPAEFVKAETGDGVPDGTSVVGADTWERRVKGDGGTRSLVLSSAAVTTVVSGDTSYAALESYAATLRSN